MTIPDRKAILIACALVVLLLGYAVAPGLGLAALVANIALVGLVVWEGRRLRRAGVEVAREDWGRRQIGRDAEFVYRVENRGDRRVLVEIRQTWPDAFEEALDRAEVEVNPRETVRVALRATPRSRGRVPVPPAEVDVRFSKGVARLRLLVSECGTVTVYPDLQSLAEYDQMRRSHALNRFGVHRIRQIGAGREFDEIRDYLPDDDYRDINWKATARARRPMTNIYQAERSQDLLLCLDCGRMMGDPVGRQTAMDYAVDASIMLAHAACRQRDRVGLATFGDSVKLFLKPTAGTRAVQRIVSELVKTETTPAFPSYAALAKVLRFRHKRRSMVFLFTDMNDPQLVTDLCAVSPLVSARHVFVVVSLRDPALERAASGPAAKRADIMDVFAARRLADERDARSLDLVRQGVQPLEADAGKLTMATLNRYLEIKMRQLV